MGDVIVGVHQPNFFPWFGYFLKIARSDKFVFLDDVQISNTSSYINRTSININGQAKWLTAPIRRTQKDQIIHETEYLDTKWRIKMLKTLMMNYSHAPYYKENEVFINSLMHFKSNNVSAFNIFIIKKICKIFDLSTEFYSAANLSIKTSSTEKLVSIVKKMHGHTYLSGLGGDKYQDAELFKSHSIHVIYNAFEHPKYKQVRMKSTIKGLSILDYIYNLGFDKTMILLNNSIAYS